MRRVCFRRLLLGQTGAPKRVLQTHSSDQVAYPFADPRSATERIRANGAARADLIDFDPRVAVLDTSFHIMPRACARPAAPVKVGRRPPARNSGRGIGATSDCMSMRTL